MASLNLFFQCCQFCLAMLEEFELEYKDMMHQVFVLVQHNSAKCNSVQLSSTQLNSAHNISIVYHYLTGLVQLVSAVLNSDGNADRSTKKVLWLCHPVQVLLVKVMNSTSSFFCLCFFNKIQICKRFKRMLLITISILLNLLCAWILF